MNARGRSFKIFNDTVHGHITVPTKWCELIIDTAQFQRLKRIEQSFVSTIFPSATHNRFTHSLGVYHIGSMLFQELMRRGDVRNKLKETSTGSYSIYTDDTSAGISMYDVLNDSYLIACLLHDCGHSPFSHTFEKYYTINGKENAILNEMCSFATQLSSISEYSDNFIDDLKSCISNVHINPHELVSAWLVMNPKGFAPRIQNRHIHADPLLVARMVTGVTFSEEVALNDEIYSILNCFIGLLNGNAVDADRIDYSLRDQWATGNMAAVFNVKRMIDSIILEKGETGYHICYDKRCLSELHYIQEIKNRNNFWVFNHHKFKLLEDSIKQAVGKLALLMSIQINPDTKQQATTLGEPEALAELFDYKTLVQKKDFSFYIGGSERHNICKESIIYPSDDDIIHLLKKYFSDVADTLSYDSFYVKTGAQLFNEWQSRNSAFLPLWKSYYEYREICYNPLEEKIKEFDSLTIDEKGEDVISDNEENEASQGVELSAIIKVVQRTVQKVFDGAESRIIRADISLDNIKEEENINIKMHGQIIPYERLAIPMQNYDMQDDSFFYCFIKCEDAKKIFTDDDSDYYSLCVQRLRKALSELTIVDVKQILLT